MGMGFGDCPPTLTLLQHSADQLQVNILEDTSTPQYLAAGPDPFHTGFRSFASSGALLFGDPTRYASNIGFRIKAILILVAGLNALLFYWKVNPGMAAWGDRGNPPALAKTVAALSLGIWFSILLLGRLIPYVGTG